MATDEEINQLVDDYVDELHALESAQLETKMTFTRVGMKKLLHGVSAHAVPAPPTPVSSSKPTISGNALVGDTLTMAHATYSPVPVNYQVQWQQAAAPYGPTDWADISAETAATYLQDVADDGYQIRVGERPYEPFGGFGIWNYSDPVGPVSTAAVVPDPPVINTAALPTPNSGLVVGDSVVFVAPSITGATNFFVSIRVNGVQREAFATAADTFPFTYIIQPQDVGTVEFRTTAQNANPVTDYVDVSVGAVADTPGGTSIIDLGSTDATRAFIESGYNAGWVKTGTATNTATVNSATELKSLWDTTLKTAPKTQRWDITMNWDGLSADGVETTYMQLFMPSGPSWADNGGWLNFKAAAGKNPAFANALWFQNARGINFEGVDKNNTVDFFGKRSFTTAGGGNTNGIIYLDISAGENIITMQNVRFGRRCIDPSDGYTTWMRAIASNGKLNGQLYMDTVTMAGCFVAVHGTFRLFKCTNFDIQMNIEDVYKLYSHTGSNYYAYYWWEHGTIRLQYDDVSAVGGYHADLVQTGNVQFDNELGCRMIMYNVVFHGDHKFGNPNGPDGGTQGFQIGNDADADHLFAVKNIVFLHSSPNSLWTYSPSATYCSYVENFTFNRCGIIPSSFGGYSDDKDTAQGVSVSVAPAKSGVSWRLLNGLVGKPGAVSGVTYIEASTTVFGIDPRIGWTGFRPEDVFNGRDFERGGTLTANGIADKFGYIMPNESGTQAEFLADVFANWTPQGAFAGKGCPVLDPADFQAPPLG